MGGFFNVWLIILVVAIGLPIIIIATENSDRTLSRQRYLYRVLTFVGLILLSSVLNQLPGDSGAGQLISGLADLAAFAYGLYFYRPIVQRLRDAGRGKALAYVAIIPLLNIIIPIYLLFVPTQSATEALDIEAF